MKWTKTQKVEGSTDARRTWQRRVAADPDAHPLARAHAKPDLTQAQTAALADAPPSTIIRIEGGHRVSSSTQDRVAQVFASGPETLLATWIEPFG